LADLGLLLLVQKKFGPADYAYIAVRSSKPIRAAFQKEKAE
jgi:hypothetical protein